MENIKSLLNVLCNFNDKSFSVELCSNKQLDVNSLSSINPLFYSITWHHHHQYYECPDYMNNIPALTLAASLIALGKHVLLHLPCRYVAKQDMFRILTIAKNIGVKNILALQGDFIETVHCTKSTADFPHAIHLVRYIKENFTSFCVGVAGYPSCHPESLSMSTDISHLKEKIDAGADFIVTQAIFEPEVFHTFYKNCREIGITVPIIPGIYVIKSYEGLLQMSNICKFNIPPNILKDVQSMKHDNGVREFGIRLATDLIKNLLRNETYPVSNVHIFSLNNIENIQLLSKHAIQ